MFFLQLCVSLKLSAQTAAVHGIVSDVKGNALAGVKVSVSDTIAAYIAHSDKHGNYELVLPDSLIPCDLLFVCPGYMEQVKHVEKSEHINCNVVMADRVHELSEVEVVRKQVISKPDRMVLFPNSSQVNASNSGTGLLASMLLPQIDVNRITGEVHSIKGGNIVICIDNREVSKEEVDNLRPKDVMRVEVAENPTGRFSGASVVINFVMRHYDRGMYSEIKTENSFLHQAGKYTAVSKIENKRMSYSLLVGSDYTKEKDTGSLLRETYNLGSLGNQVTTSGRSLNSFLMDTSTDGGKATKYSHYGSLRSAYRSEKTLAFMRLGLVWDNEPHFHRDYSVAYTPAIQKGASALEQRRSSGVQPTVELHLWKDLGNKSEMLLYSLYAHGHSKRMRSYEETSASKTHMSSYDITEDNDFWSIIGFYKFPVGKQDNIVLRSEYMYYGGGADYTGIGRRSTKTSRGSLMGGYTKLFSDKGLIYGDIMLSERYDKNNEEKGTNNLYVDLSLTGNMKLGKKGKLIMKASYNNVHGEFQYDGDMQVNQYKIIRGNLISDMYKTITGFISYDHTNDLLSLSCYAKYNGLLNPFCSYHYEENGMVIQSFRNNGNQHTGDIGTSATLSLLRHKFQVRAKADWLVQSFNGDKDNSVRSLTASLKASYMFGACSASAYYETGNKMLNVNNEVIRNRPDYGLSFTWGWKGWFLETGARRVFYKKTDMRTYYESGLYSYENINNKSSLGRQLYIKISYCFDMGKKVEKPSTEMNRNINSGILTM